MQLTIWSMQEAAGKKEETKRPDSKNCRKAVGAAEWMSNRHMIHTAKDTAPVIVLTLLSNEMPNLVKSGG